MLNENYEPATIFNEGENFTFQFSISNESKKSLINDYQLFIADIFNVYDKNKNYGKPYEFEYVIEVGPGAFPFPPNSTYNLLVPWKDERETWDSLYHYLKGLSKDLLIKGKYYTEFSHQFNFGSVKTELLNFKINFEIK